MHLGRKRFKFLLRRDVSAEEARNFTLKATERKSKDVSLKRTKFDGQAFHWSIPSSGGRFQHHAGKQKHIADDLLVLFLSQC